jgi:collagen type VI alpha/Meckel syndrome type 1 protein
VRADPRAILAVALALAASRFVALARAGASGELDGARPPAQGLPAAALPVAALPAAAQPAAAQPAAAQPAAAQPAAAQPAAAQPAAAQPAAAQPAAAPPAVAQPAAAPPAVDPDVAPRAALARELADQAAAVDRALAAVGDKLTGVEAARSRRLAAAVRAVRADPTEDAAAVARRRAAARVLLQRDLDERALLVDELTRLRGARDRVAGDLARLPAVALPGELARPAPGAIARHFGTLAHERSKATLSRRGIDLEVDDHSPVTAPAAGTVRYAGPIRGLDQGVIIDCGDFVAVVGKLGEIAAPVGAPIAAGDRLGRAARHRVYLEIRVKLGPGGLPIDPEPLLAGPAVRAPAHPAPAPHRATPASRNTPARAPGAAPPAAAGRDML